MPASVDRSRYYGIQLKNPKGYGHWLFKIGSEEFSYTGSFGKALAAAQKRATKLKATRIIVMP